MDVTREHRAKLKNQKPVVVWILGFLVQESLLANALEKTITNEFYTFILDGDNIRLGLNKDLGFTDATG